jgi:hypothetical protein
VRHRPPGQAAERMPLLQLERRGLRKGDRSAHRAGSKNEMVFMENEELEPLVLVRERDCLCPGFIARHEV